MSSITGEKAVISRFLSKVKITDSGCWNWKDSLTFGYGHFWIKQKKYSSHRWIYEYCYDSIPNEYAIHHKCENKKCCNPCHLEKVTSLEHKQKHIITYCKKGHEFNTENTYLWQNTRLCRICRTNNVYRYCKNNPEKVKASELKYHIIHRPKRIEYGRLYRLKNRQLINENQRRSRREKHVY